MPTRLRRRGAKNRTPIESLTRAVIVAAVVIVAAIVLVGIWNDHRSCERQIPIRSAMRSSLENQADTAARLAQVQPGAIGTIRLVYATEQRHVRALLKLPDCGGLIPDGS